MKTLFPRACVLEKPYSPKSVHETVNAAQTTVALNYDSVKDPKHAEYNQYRSRNKDEILIE
jgi:hypothetical protein